MADLTPIERKIASLLLRRASEEFSNHGCNDLELRSELGLTEDEAFEILTAIHAASDDEGADPPTRGARMYTMDWLVMSYLAEKLASDPV
jgi:hypothetical protein